MPFCTVVKFLDGQYTGALLGLLAGLMLDVVDMPPFMVDEVNTRDEPCMKPIVSSLFSFAEEDM